jgi:hypothetical protein
VISRASESIRYEIVNTLGVVIAFGELSPFDSQAIMAPAGCYFVRHIVDGVLRTLPVIIM